VDAIAQPQMYCHAWTLGANVGMMARRVIGWGMEKVGSTHQQNVSSQSHIKSPRQKGEHSTLHESKHQQNGKAITHSMSFHLCWTEPEQPLHPKYGIVMNANKAHKDDDGTIVQ
jgi:hypothetical protein